MNSDLLRHSEFRTPHSAFGWLPDQKRKMRGERSKRLAYPQADSAPESNSSPGTMISTPVFECELFVAHPEHHVSRGEMQHRVITKVINSLSSAARLARVRRLSRQSEEVVAHRGGAARYKF